MTEDYKPRFIFDITQEQKDRADRLLTAYGVRKAVFCCILDDVLDLIEERGPIALGVLMSGALKPRDMFPSIKRAEEATKKDG